MQPLYQERYGRKQPTLSARAVKTNRTWNSPVKNVDQPLLDRLEVDAETTAPCATRCMAEWPGAQSVGDWGIPIALASAVSCSRMAVISRPVICSRALLTSSPVALAACQSPCQQG